MNSAKNILLLFVLGLLLSCDSVDSLEFVDLDDRVSKQEVNAQAKLNTPENELVFGFDLRTSPQEDARQYLPFMDYLEKTTGYPFRLNFSSQNQSIIDELGDGYVDFAFMGAVSFIKTNLLYDSIMLVRGKNNQDMAKYRSLIVVRPDSAIQKIEDLKAKRFAFGGVNSTQGHLIPRIILLEHGLKLEDFADYQFTGSHQNCAEAVIAGKADACGMQDILAEHIAKEGFLRIIYRSRYFPSSGVVARKDINPEVIKQVTSALLGFDPQGKNKQGLYDWEKTEMSQGFAPAQASDYEELKNWAIRIGFIKPAKALSESVL